MIKVNNITYIGFEDSLEYWKDIEFQDIIPNKYEVSSLGRIRKKNSGKICKGNNPLNERGYCRVSLKSISGKIKKYAVHRLVLNAFGDYDPELEVNHIDGNPLNNSIYNLEKANRQENAHHAATHDLYEFCEDRYNSVFSNHEVHEICKMLESGHSVSYIIDKLKLHNRGYNIYSNIDKIINGKTYTRISSQYKFDWNKYHYKTYSYDDINIMCDCIFNRHMKNAEIVKLFPKYNSKNLKTALKSMRAGKIYKPIVNKYNRSTTTN